MRTFLLVAILGSVPSLACNAGSAAAGAPARDGVLAEPAVLSLGPVSPGQTTEGVVTLRTAGRVAVPVIAIDVVPAAAGFELIDRPATIVPAGTEVRVSFRPTAPGRVPGRLALSLDSRETPVLEVPLDGTAIGTALACEPNTFAFGEVLVGTMRERTIFCTNTGHAIDGGGYVAVLGAVSDSPHVSAELAQQDLAPGERMEIALRFAPQEDVSVNARLRLQTEPGGLVEPFTVWGRGITEPCRLAFEPAPAEAPPGARSRTELIVRNYGASACSIDGATLVEPCTAFSLADPIEPVWIAPGESTSLAFEYHPAALGRHACDVALATDPPLRTTIEGTCSYRSCLATSGSADFGSGVWTCPIERELALENRCTVTIPLEAAVEGPSADAFSLGTVPGTLPPRVTTTLPLAFLPPDEGTFHGLLRVGAPGDQHLELPLVGVGERPRPITRGADIELAVNPPSALVVVDNGASMAPIVGRVRSGLGGLFELIEASNRLASDHGLAVTTSGLAPDPACTAPVSGGEDGRFVPVDGSRPRAVRRHTADRLATVEANLAVGACHQAPAQLLEAAVRALSPPLSTSADDPRHPEPNDGNAGLLPGASYLVLVSNRDDASPLSPAEYGRRLAELGIREVLVIAGDEWSGCRWNEILATSAPRLASFVAGFPTDRGFPRARAASICGWPWSLEQFPPVLALGCFPDANRDGRVDDADVRVNWNGTRLLASNGDWRFDAASRRVLAKARVGYNSYALTILAP